MFVPVYDENPLKTIRFQYVTLAILCINVAVYAFEALTSDPVLVASFAIVPRQLLEAHILGPHTRGAADLIPLPERYTLFTYMFFHGDLVHLFGNMLFLWVFGDNVEDAMGHLRFAIFYVACGVLAGLAHALIQPASSVPLIGASGAVAGVIAAYLMLHPRIHVWVLAFKIIPLRISALVCLGLWIALQVAMVVLQPAGPVAWWAHVGGLVAGALLVIVLRRPGVPLFGSAPSVRAA